MVNQGNFADCSTATTKDLAWGSIGACGLTAGHDMHLKKWGGDQPAPTCGLGYLLQPPAMSPSGPAPSGASWELAGTPCWGHCRWDGVALPVLEGTGWEVPVPAACSPHPHGAWLGLAGEMEPLREAIGCGYCGSCHCGGSGGVMVAPALGPPPCRQLAGTPGLSQAGALLRRGTAELSCKQDSLSRLPLAQPGLRCPPEMCGRFISSNFLSTKCI